MRKRGWFMLVIATIVLGLAWWLWPRPSTSPSDRLNSTVPASASSSTPSASSRPGVAARSETDASAGAKATASRRDMKARAELRRRILESLRSRTDAEGTTTAPPPREPPPEHERANSDDTEPATGGGLIDRTGERPYTVQVLNDDLMPLIDECYTMALERNSTLRGMLVVEFAIIGDEQIGGVVESVTTRDDSEIVEPEMLECISESILSVTLPPPEQSGRDQVALSVRFEPGDNEPSPNPGDPPADPATP